MFVCLEGGEGGGVVQQEYRAELEGRGKVIKRKDNPLVHLSYLQSNVTVSSSITSSTKK